MRRKVMTWLGVGLALATVAVLGWVVVAVPDRVIPLPTPAETAAVKEPAARLGAVDSRMKLRNDMRVSLVQLFAALGVAGGLYFTYRTFRLNRDAQVTDRFAKAVEQLGDRDKPDVALGGIHSLARLAQDSRVDRQAIVSVLAAHVRRLAPYPPVANGLPATARAGLIGPYEERLPTVQAALHLLTDLDAGKRVDLRKTDLRGADLEGRNMRGWRLSGAQFTAADLRGADLREADLTGTDLTEATTDDRTRLPAGSPPVIPQQTTHPT